MDMQGKPTVAPELFVNEATLDLLRRQIEADVKRAFARRVLLPIGLIAVAAVAFSVLWWIPKSIEDYFKKDPESLQSMIKSSVSTFLQNPDELGPVVRREVARVVKEEPLVHDRINNAVNGYLNDPEMGGKRIGDAVAVASKKHVGAGVGAYFESEMGKSFLGDSVRQETAAFLEQGSWLTPEVHELIDKHLGSEVVRRILMDSISTAFSPDDG